MRKLYILIFALSLFTGTAFGQMVKGHVYDAETHEPLPGVNITYKKINGDTNGTISDADGAYEIALPDGGIDLLFSYIGYENEQLPLILRKGDTKTKDVYMNIKTNLLGDVVVSAGRFEQKLSDVTVSMDLLKAGDIAKQAPTDLSSTLNTMPGVDINDKQPSIRGGNGWTYGVGSRSLVLVDGMSALSSGNGVINWNIVPLENIEQVEVMKGASSVLYGSSALNGVINIRTKRPDSRRPQVPAPMSEYTTIRFMTNMKGQTSRTHDGSETSMYRADSTCFPMTDTAIKDTTGVCDSEAI